MAGTDGGLGPADALTAAHLDDPGRYVTAVDGDVPVLPLPGERAVRPLGKHGFVAATRAQTDARADEGWTQVAAMSWTAPCHPAV